MEIWKLKRGHSIQKKIFKSVLIKNNENYVLKNNENYVSKKREPFEVKKKIC